MKRICLVFVLTLLSLSVADEPIDESITSPRVNDLIVGSRVPGDELILEERLKVPFKWFQHVEVNTTFGAPPRHIITQAILRDLTSRDHGAIPSVILGGPGHDFITINFKSEWFRGIHFYILVFGKRIR